MGYYSMGYLRFYCSILPAMSLDGIIALDITEGSYTKDHVVTIICYHFLYIIQHLCLQ